LTNKQLINHEVIEKQLDDPEPHVRELALRLLADPLSRHDIDTHARTIIALASDKDERVRMRALLLLGRIKNPERWATIANEFGRDANDVWMRRAIIVAVGRGLVSFLETLERDRPAWTVAPNRTQIDNLRLLGLALGEAGAEAEDLPRVLEKLVQPGS